MKNTIAPCELLVNVHRYDRSETYVRNFATMPDKTVKLRNLMNHVGMDTKSYQRAFTSLHLLQADVSVTRYDIETSSLIINVPNNPSAQNTAIATRSLDTRGSERFALSINSL